MPDHEANARAAEAQARHEEASALHERHALHEHEQARRRGPAT